jgi:hypothetical protein
MYQCVICRFVVELDDAVTPTGSWCCVCLRCYTRETATARLMTRELRHELADALANVGALL